MGRWGGMRLGSNPGLLSVQRARQKTKGGRFWSVLAHSLWNGLSLLLRVSKTGFLLVLGTSYVMVLCLVVLCYFSLLCIHFVTFTMKRCYINKASLIYLLSERIMG